MRNARWLLCILAVLGILALLTATAVAQTPPVRVVQGSDGTLYLVQGSQAWLLVPDQVSDEDLAGLDLGGEVDGALPDAVLSVSAAPAVVPDVAPAEPIAPPAPTATPVPVTRPANPIRRALPTSAPAPTSVTRSTPGAIRK